MRGLRRADDTLIAAPVKLQKDLLLEISLWHGHFDASAVCAGSRSGHADRAAAPAGMTLDGVFQQNPNIHLKLSGCQHISNI